MKTYINVECKALPGGKKIPVLIQWHDGRTWKIKRILHVSLPAEGEFEGIRYTVMIGSAEKYLYKENDKWYVVSA